MSRTNKVIFWIVVPIGLACAALSMVSDYMDKSGWLKALRGVTLAMVVISLMLIRNLIKSRDSK